MYNPWVSMEHRQWEHRQSLIRERLLESHADIICLQEADGDTFDEDFAFLMARDYEACLHNKYRFRCATFFKRDKFELDQVSYRDRALVTSLKVLHHNPANKDANSPMTKPKGKKQGNRKNNDDNSSTRLLHVVNCHLSGGAAPERRLRQVHQALDQIRKWNRKACAALEKQETANRPNPKNLEKAAMEVQRHQNAATLVLGDFNSDGNTAVRRLLVEGSVEPEWREPQYPMVPLTSNTKHNPLEDCLMVDAAELAYGANVCDGDYGEDNPPATVLGDDDDSSPSSWRPPTYVVPNLAALLLLPLDEQDGAPPRTEFGIQVAQGLANTLGLQAFSQEEMEQAFETIDLDGNNHIDEAEVQTLLESVYVATYGEKFLVEKEKFFRGFRSSDGGGGLTREQFAKKLMTLHQQQHVTTNTESDSVADFGQLLPKGVMDALGVQKLGCEKEMNQAFESIDLDGNNVIDENEIQSLLESVYFAIYGEQIKAQRTSFFSGFQESRVVAQKGLSRNQFIEKLTALQQELEGGSEGSELVEIRTEIDAQRMIARFTPLLKSSLDHVFGMFSDDGETLTEDELDKFLVQVNGAVDRGGISRHTAGILEKKTNMSEPAVLTRDDWYDVFARELGEGKWWQVVYDLETCGATIRSRSTTNECQHYQAWLDYLYFDSHKLQCEGFQEALTKAEVSRMYQEGDTLPNEWHPSDHLPVAAIFSWAL
jgi:endonuclease/exonuclease/phosphatase family metal-dependent hydrolase/Ca2+-binding EF-hand superfamily protein